MKIIYYCYGGAHSSVVAAAIHLKHLPVNRIAKEEEILALPDFDVARNDSLGHLFYKGTDEMGHQIYTIGMGPEMHIVHRSILSMIQMSEHQEEAFYFAHALPHIKRMAKIGGALSRRYGIVRLGRFFAARGVHSSYADLVQFVLETKKEIEKINKKLIQ